MCIRDRDHSDTPRSAARILRYADKYVTVKQGEVMYMTEALANLEGIERGPAGNTALAAAFSLAQELPEDAIVVISETEYTGAGKHIPVSYTHLHGYQWTDGCGEITGQN